MDELNHGLERNLDVITLMRHKKRRGVRLPFPSPTSIQAANTLSSNKTTIQETQEGPGVTDEPNF